MSAARRSLRHEGRRSAADDSYDALKKLFPSTPLDPSYHSTQDQQESSSLLPVSRPQAKYATPDQFRAALDKEKEKVIAFYKTKEDELHRSLEILEDEVLVLEDRDLGTDDVIKEEDEDEGDPDDEDGDRSEGEALLSPRINPNATPARPKFQPRRSIFNRFTAGLGGRRRKGVKTIDQADILEAALAPPLDRRRSSSMPRNGMMASVSTLGGASQAAGPDEGSSSSPLLSSARSMPKLGGRRSSEMEHDDSGGHDRRTSISSNSSHGEFWSARRRHLSLGLVQMDEDDVPSFARGDDVDANGFDGARPTFVWTANNDYATVVRIGFKKRISALWLEAYALKQYVDLNLTAFEKILKK